MRTRVRKFAHVLERIGLAMVGAASGLFVGVHVGSSVAPFTSQGFLPAVEGKLAEGVSTEGRWKSYGIFDFRISTHGSSYARLSSDRREAAAALAISACLSPCRQTRYEPPLMGAFGDRCEARAFDKDFLAVG